MTTLHGLPPIENPNARALVLGSMPGGASLRAGRYYAHGQNLFWTFMGDFVGATPALSYEARIDRLRDAGIALWDVIATCERDGSLDSAIRGAVANDFAAFFAMHRHLRAVLFNGATAEATFRRQVPEDIVPAGVKLVRLPSTSPANRSIPTDTKRDAWRAALADAGVRLQSPPV
ncbi:DNA-deoxyinosine glycosylase [Cognatilysobacter terrigena]|uniref:DNA-deoxyinosine glycosylase n=1 Tax=Cognatilysobacter terrigena TaxID=2488749 RepID=UPI00105D4395|nr:DNA-deoxyinosine glycosylase [Lysobacter terrigena]